MPPSYVSMSNVDHDITAITALVDAVAFDSTGDYLTVHIEFHDSAILQAYTLRTSAQAERHDQRKNQCKDFLHRFPLFLSQIVCFKTQVRNLPQIMVNRSISVQNVVKIQSLGRFRDL